MSSFMLYIVLVDNIYQLNPVTLDSDKLEHLKAVLCHARTTPWGLSEKLHHS